MTRRLEELFEMDSSDKSEDDVSATDVSTTPQELISTETLASIEKIEAALPQVKDLEKTDTELDELSDLAKAEFKNLMDLGMQVDSRFSSEIFNVASSMLGHAITTKTAKINRKLKMIDLQLKKAELDRKIAIADNKASSPGSPTDLGSAKIIDRNELLKAILKESQDGKISDKDK